MLPFRQYVPLAVFLLLIVVSFFVVKPLLMPLFLSAILAFTFQPLYVWISKKLHPVVSALLVCVLVLAIFLVPGVFLIKTLIQESYILFISVKQKLAVGLFQSCANSFCQIIETVAQDPVFATQLKEMTARISNTIIQRGSAFLISVPRLVVDLFVILFTMFYLLKDGPALMKQVSNLLSMQEHRYQFVLRRLKDILQGVVYGYFLIALLQGALGAVGFYLFGVSSPLFWGGVMAIFALIPFIGTGVIWGPAAVVVFLNGLFANDPTLMFKGIGLFLYSLLFVASIDNILKPKFIGRKAGIHPGIIFVGLIGGALVFGPLGVLIGPIILSLTLVFVECYFQKFPDRERA